MIALLDDFQRHHCASRDAIVAFAARSPRLADLARTHPILFVALATGYGDPERRAAAIEAALSGRRLRRVCELAAIPYCLRSVPRESCPVPLPHADWSAEASQMLAKYIPDDPMTLCNWVPGVFFANGAADAAFALWLAVRYDLFIREYLSSHYLMPLALYAWFSRHPGNGLHDLLPARWSGHAGSKRALSAVRAWLYRICCRIYLPGTCGGENSTVYNVGAFTAIELTDWRSLLDEQTVMENCLDRYGRRISSGTHSIFSLRTDSGVPIANFEVGLHGPDGPLVTEIKGRSNVTVPSEIYDPVLQWVSEAGPMLRDAGVVRSQMKVEADEIFEQLIAPYVATHAEVIARYGPITFDSLERDLSKLAARLGITSWPVRYVR